MRVRPIRNATKKRKQRRADAFGETASLRTRHERDVGWFRAPRTLPIVMQLLRENEVVGKVACDQVYLELLARDFGDGFIETKDEKEHAFLSGYRTERGERTWRERVDKLVELGFLESRERYGHRHGHLLLKDPHVAVLRLAQRFADRTDLTSLFQSYLLRRKDIGAADTMRAAVREGVFAKAAFMGAEVAFKHVPSDEANLAAAAPDLEDADGCARLWKLCVRELRPVLDAQNDDALRRFAETVVEVARHRIPKEPTETSWQTFEKLLGRALPGNAVAADDD